METKRRKDAFTVPETNHHPAMSLELKDLVKRRDEAFTLGPVNISLAAGQTAALFGRNGAGKSTLFQLTTGNLDATSGEVWFLGQRLVPEAFALKRRIGYLPQHLTLPRWVTGSEILAYAATLYEFQDRKTAVQEALAYWDCLSYKDTPLASLSHGMQKRVGLALATLHRPPCLILDEPFSGLDIYHIRALEDHIEERHRSGLITILSTHTVSHAAKLCSTAFVLKAGVLTPMDAWPSLDFMGRVEAVEKTFF